MAASGFNIRFGRRGRGRDNKPPGVVGKLGLSLFFLMFFLMGSLFEVLIARDFLQRVQRRFWKTASCTILKTEIEEERGSENPYKLAIQYDYQYQGISYRSNTYALKYEGSDSYAKTSNLARRYTQGSQQRCFVNPKQPSQAVLSRGSLWMGFALLFPLIFVVIGLGGITGIWFFGSDKTKAKPKVTKIKGHSGTIAAAAFFGVFALIGAGVMVPLFILPVLRIIDARSWQATPCRVVHSEVRSHDSDDGTTYSVHILYEYSFQGQTHRNDRYSFMGGSSSGYKGKRAIVDRYRSGTQAQCWVNPKAPHEAVIQRGFSPMMFFGFIPALFLIVGIGGIFGVLRSHRKKQNGPKRAEWLPESKTAGDASDNIYADLSAGGSGPVELKPTHGRKTKLVGVIIFALFWNGIVSVFVWQVVQGFRQGHPSWGLTLFMIPFVLVGLGTVAGVVYQFLALFNPRTVVRLGAEQIPLGDQVSLAWEVSGRVERLQKFTVTLTGKEEAKYRRGTSTYTAHNTFLKQELVALTDPLAMAQGQTTLAIPSDTMHSFKTDNNKILWSLTVHGDVPRWPDIKDSFEIVVPPMRAERVAQQGVNLKEEEVAWALPVGEDGG